MSIASERGSLREGAPKGNPCPRCSKPLTDAAGLGWCSACGYCRSLEEAQASLPAPRDETDKKVSLGGLIELGEAVGGLPRWVWIMLMGMIGFGVFSALPALQLPKNTLDRALWTACQIGVGLSMIFIAQFVAVIRIAPEDAKISFKDVLLPFRLWGLILKRLPRTCTCVWLGAWGLTLIAAALIFIGGLPYLMNYLPGNKNNLKHGKKVSQAAIPASVSIAPREFV